MADILSFPEKVDTLALSRRAQRVDAMQLDAQLSDQIMKLSCLKTGDAKLDLSIAIFVLTVTLSHASRATQLIPDPDLRKQFDEKLHEIDGLLRTTTAAN